MLFIILTFLIFITQFIFSQWWIIVIDSFLAALLVGRTAIGSFFSGFFSVALVWFGFSYYLDFQNSFLLASKIAILLNLPNHYYVVAITTLIGGVVGGFSALSGYSFKALGKRRY